MSVFILVRHSYHILVVSLLSELNKFDPTLENDQTPLLVSSSAPGKDVSLNNDQYIIGISIGK